MYMYTCGWNHMDRELIGITFWQKLHLQNMRRHRNFWLFWTWGGRLSLRTFITSRIMTSPHSILSTMQSASSFVWYNRPLQHRKEGNGISDRHILKECVEIYCIWQLSCIDLYILVHCIYIIDLYTYNLTTFYSGMMYPYLCIHIYRRYFLVPYYINIEMKSGFSIHDNQLSRRRFQNIGQIVRPSIKLIV